MVGPTLSRSRRAWRWVRRRDVRGGLIQVVKGVVAAVAA